MSDTTIHPRAVHKAHALAAIFPMAQPQTLTEVIDDMKQHGFNAEHPIVLLDGDVLDGRNRLYCALEAGVEPKFRTYDAEKDGPAHEFVSRENLARRHMNPGQRAAVAAALLPYYAAPQTGEAPQATEPPRAAEPAAAQATPAPEATEQAEPPQTNAPATRETVAKVAAITEASPTNIKNANKLKKEAPDLFAKVESGAMTIASAMSTLKERKLGAEARAKKEKEKTERSDALKAIEATFGSESETLKAIKGKKILKVHDDLLIFSTLDKISAQKLVPLLAKGWRLEKAQKFLTSKLMPESSIEDLINAAIASDNDPFEIKIAGHWITVSKDDGKAAE